MSHETSPGSERRRFTRVPARFKVDLETEEGLELRGTLLNLSVRGFFFRTQEFAPVGSRCRIELYPLDNSTQAFPATGVIKREGIGGFGVEFDSLPYETFEVVRSFVQRVSKHPEHVEDELVDRLGIPPGE